MKRNAPASRKDGVEYKTPLARRQGISVLLLIFALLAVFGLTHFFLPHTVNPMPQPGPTPTSTSISTRTPTLVSTPTLVPTPQLTPTPISTPKPKATSQSTATPISAITPVPTSQPTPTPTPTPTPPNFTVVQRQATVIGNPHAFHAEAMISCDSGEQMLSGGYEGSSPLASYPSGANTWDVVVDNHGPVTAYVLCLQAGFHAQIQTVTQSGSVSVAGTLLTVTVNCPAGTVLIGGGFGAPFRHPGATVSAPTDDLGGWTASFGLITRTDISATAYARCASASLTGVVAVPKPFAISTDPSNATGASVGCSGNQFLAGGGYLSQDPTDLGVSISASGSLDNKYWTIKGTRVSASPFQVTAYALCVTPP